MKIIVPLLLSASLASLPIYAQQTLNDAQIAAIVVVANQVDIDAGQYVVAKTKNPDVTRFAATMVTDHSAVNKSAVDLVTKLRVTPEENETSRSLKDGGDNNLAQLRALKGKALDRAYIDHEVAYHEQVIRALDTALIPNASNSELKALLFKVRPAFVEHLGHARHLQASYK